MNKRQKAWYEKTIEETDKALESNIPEDRRKRLMILGELLRLDMREDKTRMYKETHDLGGAYSKAKEKEGEE